MVRSHLPQTAKPSMELAGYLMNGLIRNKEEDNKVVDSERRKDTNFKGTQSEVKKGGFILTILLCTTCKRCHMGDVDMKLLLQQPKYAIHVSSQDMWQQTVGRKTDFFNRKEMGSFI